MSDRTPARFLSALALLVAVVAVLPAVAGCQGSRQALAGPDGTRGPGPSVLFVGNSLTAANGLPDLVAAMGRAAGDGGAVAAVTRPGAAIEDHWTGGLSERIQRARAEVVVLQQGPSTLPASRENLVEWARRVAPVVREAGGEPALLMVWPDGSRREAGARPDTADYRAVLGSYRAAADAVEGILIPAGEAFRYLESLDPDADPYGPDGFHPSPLGTLTAALTVHASLWRTEVALLEPILRATAAGTGVDLSPERARTVVRAVLLALEDEQLRQTRVRIPQR